MSGERKESISYDFLQWMAECKESLEEKISFISCFPSSEQHAFFLRNGIVATNQEDFTRLEPIYSCEYKEDFQIVGRAIFSREQKFSFCLNKIFNVCDLPSIYGFDNLSKTLLVKRDKLIFYSLIVTVLIFLLLLYYLSVSRAILISIAIIGFSLTFINYKEEVKVSIPSDLLYTLANQGFTFHFEPQYRGKKFAVWQKRENNKVPRKIPDSEEDSNNLDSSILPITKEDENSSNTESNKEFNTFEKEKNTVNEDISIEDLQFACLNKSNIDIENSGLEEYRDILLKYIKDNQVDLKNGVLVYCDDIKSKTIFPYYYIDRNGFQNDIKDINNNCIPKWKLEVCNYAETLVNLKTFLSSNKEMLGITVKGIYLCARKGNIVYRIGKESL